jgi:hypothetical protein
MQRHRGDPNKETEVSTCIHHPDRETRYRCSKHDIYLCEACLDCRDPELYCKFRTSCPIWFMTRKQKQLADPDPADHGPPDQGPNARAEDKLAAGSADPG